MSCLWLWPLLVHCGDETTDRWTNWHWWRKESTIVEGTTDGKGLKRIRFQECIGITYRQHSIEHPTKLAQQQQLSGWDILWHECPRTKTLSQRKYRTSDGCEIILRIEKCIGVFSSCAIPAQTMPCHWRPSVKWLCRVLTPGPLKCALLISIGCAFLGSCCNINYGGQEQRWLIPARHPDIINVTNTPSASRSQSVCGDCLFNGVLVSRNNSTWLDFPVPVVGRSLGQDWNIFIYIL